MYNHNILITKQIGFAFIKLIRLCIFMSPLFLSLMLSHSPISLFLCCHASKSNLSKVLAGFDMTNLGSRTFFPLTILFWRYFVEEYFQKCGESTLLINKSKADPLCYRNVMVLHR